MIYLVPTTAANAWLKDKEYIVATDEGEAVAMACGEYLATGNKATVVMGDNGFLNALDALITLVGMYSIPVNVRVYLRHDEPQHALVAKHAKKVAKLYGIKARFID